ncbi:MAG: phospholipase A [Verrucomicrobiota bacterium]
MSSGFWFRFGWVWWFSGWLVWGEPAAGLTWLLAPAGAGDGRPPRVWVHVLNPGNVPHEAEFPDPLQVQIRERGRVRAGWLRPVMGPESAILRLPPGQFARRAYEWPPGEAPAGPASLALREAPGVWVAWEGMTETPTDPVTGDSRGATGPTAPGDASASDARTGEGTDQPSPARSAAEESSMLVFFRNHFSPYEPMYFIAGSEQPNAKFQISLRYRLLNAGPGEPGWLARTVPPLKNLFLAYTQTSLWDLEAESAPFLDSSYRPELLYEWQRLAGGRRGGWFRLDLQGGFQHESNGKDGANSRSLNIAYLQPTIFVGDPEDLHFRLGARLMAYVTELDDNPDLRNYRGNVEMRAMLGWAEGLQLSGIGRLGNDLNRGSLTLDLTYPLSRLGTRSFSVYAHLQYFIGYGESLLYYQQRSDAIRLGFSLWR